MKWHSTHRKFVITQTHTHRHTNNCGFDSHLFQRNYAHIIFEKKEQETHTFSVLFSGFGSCVGAVFLLLQFFMQCKNKCPESLMMMLLLQVVVFFFFHFSCQSILRIQNLALIQNKQKIMLTAYVHQCIRKHLKVCQLYYMKKSELHIFI